MSYLDSKLEKIIVSVIVPIYYGEKYVNHLVEIVTASFRVANIDQRAELIFINDSPEQQVHVEGPNIKIITNKKNRGIHYSRIQGIKSAQGDYIHFLDQDDDIESVFYKSQLQKIQNADCIVANAIMEHKNYSRKLYRNILERCLVTIPQSYVYIDNRIESPGQCLIRKSSIPQYWMESEMTENGADDLFLWLLMFEEKSKFKVNADILYTHKYTRENLSLDKEKMFRSVNEMVNLLGSYCPDSSLLKIQKNKLLYEKNRKIKWGTLYFSFLNAIRRVSRQIRG